MARHMAEDVITKGLRIARDARVVLGRIRETVDPREVAGGFAGLTLGETMGGAVGGVVGTLFGGPVGAAIGAEVGAFTGGLLGMSMGADTVHNLVSDSRALKDARKAGPPASAAPPPGAPEPPQAPVSEQAGSASDRRGTMMLGQAVGLASGASVGRLVAGPVGGVVGAVIGEVVGGQVAAGTGRGPARETTKRAGQPGTSSHRGTKARTADRLNRYGKRVVGESGTILVVGAAGSVFGPVGRTVGRRVGFVLGRQIKWETLTDPVPSGGNADAGPDASPAPVDPPDKDEVR